MMEERFIELQVRQRPTEEIARTVDTADYGGSPSSVAVTLEHIATGGVALPAPVDVSNTKLAGSATVASDVITTPLVTDVVAGSLYRLTVQFVAGGNTYAPYVLILGVS